MTFSSVANVGPLERDLSSVAFSPDGEMVIVGESEFDSTRVFAERELISNSLPVVRIFSIDESRKSLTELSQLKSHEKEITALAWAPDGESFLSSSTDSTVKRWQKEADGFQLTTTITADGDGVNGVAYSPLGNLFATCGNGGLVKIWDVQTNSLVRSLAGHTDFVKSVSFSANGTRILSCSSDRSAKVWSLDGEELLFCRGHYSSVMAGQFIGDGETIVTVSDDHTARIWNAKFRHSTSAFLEHKNLVWATDFSPDDKRLVSVSEDGTISMRNVETGRVIGQCTVKCCVHS